MIYEHNGHTYDIREHFYGRCAYVDASNTPQDLSDREFNTIKMEGQLKNQ